MIRGSLTDCVTAAGNLLADDSIKRLAIVNYPQAKYYALLREQELADRLEHEPDLGQRIVINATPREWLIICRSDQYNLFQEPQHGNSETTI